MDRAYSLMEVRSVSDDKRTFTGWATTPATDRMGDVVDPLGAKFKNPLPLLHQHDHQRPIGLVKFSKATADGIEFEAEIPIINEPGLLKDRVDTAWGEIKAGLVRAVSIGFRPLKDGMEALTSGGLRFTSYEVLELSAVTIPANHQALITTIKSIDAEARAAAGVEEDVSTEPKEPASSGKTAHVVKLEAPARDRAPFIINKINHRP